MTDTLKLLAVFPHPEDETMGPGSTFARYSAEGVETCLVCATHGERGWFDSEGPNPGWEEVVRIREVSLLDSIDGDVDQANPEDIIGSAGQNPRLL